MIENTSCTNIVIAGIGGSGIAGRIFQGLYTQKPVLLVEEYLMPDFVNRDTLVIAMSYSGNTEETLSAVQDAKRKHAHVVTITSGGKISSLGDQNIIIPQKGMQPRSAIGYQLMPLLLSFGISSEQDAKNARTILDGLDKDHTECTKHASNIFSGSKIPVVYGSAPFQGVPYRWKMQIGETAKVAIFANNFPSLSHTDVMGLGKGYNKDIFYYFVLEPESARIKKRMEIMAKLTKTDFNLIRPKGKSTAEKLFYYIHYGDYIAYDLAKLRSMDPQNVDLIEQIKAELARTDPKGLP